MATKSDVAKVLLAHGVEVSAISDALDLDPELLFKLKRNEGLLAESGADDIVEAMTTLAWNAYEEGSRILREGNLAQKMQIIRMMFALMAKQMGSQSPKETARLVDDFRSMIEYESDDEGEPDPDEDWSDVDEDREAI